MPELHALDAPRSPHLDDVLDEELSRLPDSYRDVIVLCDLEGLSRSQAAQQLHCPQGTVAGRLSRARELLARRLTRRGVTLSAAAFATICSSRLALGLPASALDSSLRVAAAAVAGTSALIPAPVETLSQGVLKTMALTRIKNLAVLSLALTTVIFAGSSLRMALAENPPRAKAPAEKREPGVRRPQVVDETLVKGSLGGFDVDEQTISIHTTKRDRASGETTESTKTYKLAKDVAIVQDDAPAKLAELRKGHNATLKLDKENVVRVVIDGGTTTGEFRTANLSRNTFTIVAGRDLSKRVFHLLKNSPILDADGKPIALESIKQGVRVQISLSVEDDNTALRLQVLPETNKR